ncbi:tripartite tricarboxylate transporter substrate binding protein [Bordetella sp. BOR01]|uniref:tripartite tricarboxylate transporter substrate binding protein n=1 Tax=Bordetella sp. BOR01 TaxID=2854779 RepID=UPI001C446BE7|nr:tripartite tricarboxylate transporter substrate binding protein [Bordetella sp. BOR01]MBV7482033.1 tripartite tricarboxylate transporter substrate binding protein [Bordetella sp. BOR01]
MSYLHLYLQRQVASVAALLALAGATLTAALPVHAQDIDYPDHAIRLVVPYAPGGGLTVVGRPLAQKLSERLGQPVVIESRPGAGTTLGTATVARAPADGYTLLLTLAAFTTGPSVYANLPYDVEHDFAPISTISASTSILAVPPSVPVHTLAELRDYAKRKPGGLNYASSGLGGDMHLSIASLFKQTGIPGTHVPYNGGGPAVNALLAGQVDVMLVPASFGLPLVLSGRLRPIAVSSRERWKKDLPDTPTLAESGFQGLDLDGWSGLLAPRGTPDAIVRRLNKEVNGILREPEFRTYLESVNLTPLGSTPESFEAIVTRDVKRWQQVALQIGLRPE